MAMLFDTGVFSVIGLDGAIGEGWKLGWFTAGTTTETDSFADATLATENANPVIAGASGRFPQMWLDAGAYKYVLYDADDVVKLTVDDYEVAADAPTIASALNNFLAATSPLPIANGGTASSTAPNAIAALGGLPVAGGTMTGDITKSGKGKFPYFDASGITKPAIYITASGASDPRAGTAGEIWIKY